MKLFIYFTKVNKKNKKIIILREKCETNSERFKLTLIQRMNKIRLAQIQLIENIYFLCTQIIIK